MLDIDFGEFTFQLDFSHLAVWQTASVEGFMDTPETFFGSARAGNP